MRLETSASLAPVWRMRWRPSLARWTATGAWSMTRWAVIGGHEVTWPGAHPWLAHDQINTHLGILGMHFDDFETGLMGQFDRSFRWVQETVVWTSSNITHMSDAATVSMTCLECSGGGAPPGGRRRMCAWGGRCWRRTTRRPGTSTSRSPATLTFTCR